MPEWRYLKEYQRVSCTVKEKRAAQSKATSLYRPEVQIEYEVVTSQDNKSTLFKIWTYDFNTLQNDGGYLYQKPEAESLLEPFETGKRFICWYDPQNPQKAVLFCCWTWTNIFMLIVPLSLIILGLGPLFHLSFNHSGRSREKAAHISQNSLLSLAENNGKAQSEELSPDEMESQSPAVASSVTVPSIQNITDSPGVKLKYRLPLDNSPLWGLGVLLSLCIGWGILSLAFATYAVGSFLDHRPDWVLSAFIFPFVLIWIGLIAYFLKNVQHSTAIGPTLLEIDQTPLYPGQSAKAQLIQVGANHFLVLDVNLICEEEVVFTYGTDIREEKAIVYQKNLFSGIDITVTPDKVFETSFDLNIPEKAMHSFEAAHNRVLWRLSVVGEAVGSKPFNRRFVLVVEPKKQA